MKQKHYSIASLLMIAGGTVLLLSSCGSGTEEPQTADSVAADSMIPKKKENIFYSVPSPLQLGKMLQKSGATFDKSVLNNLSNVANYSTTSSKAINLGVYGADLSYTAIFNQTQEVMSYLNAAKKLADELGSAASFSDAVIKRLKANEGNRDSTMSIISEIFLSSNETFKENEQANIYMLALAGGFTEGLYLATQSAKNVKKNDEIITRIAELKGAMNNLLSMLKEFPPDETISDIIKNFEEIKSIYDEVSEPASATITIQSDTVAKKGTIRGNSTYTLTKEQLSKLTDKVQTFRGKITK